MSDDTIGPLVTEVLPVDAKDTQPAANTPARNSRHWVPSVWAAPGAGGGAPKLSGGYEADNRSGDPVPRSWNRPDQRYEQDEATLQANRTARAVSEYPTSVVLLGANDLYEVRSASGNNYDVNQSVTQCDCPDWIRLQASGKTGVNCKHMEMVNLALADTAWLAVQPWSAEKTAQFIGVDVATVRKACTAGLITATKQHNVWVIPALQAEALSVIYTRTIPAIVSLTPDAATAGDSDTAYTIIGRGFSTVSEVLWDIGTVLSVLFVSGTELTGTIPAILLSSPGTHTVRVQNAFRGGGTSLPVLFTIT